MTYPDAELTQWVEDTMLTDPRVSSRAIRVSASDGVVTLEGTVQADERKQIALAIAATHPSCQGIVDRLQVYDPGKLSDDEIARNARAVLDALVDSVRQAAEVTVSDGVATLWGTVPTEWERAIAADAVLAAPGVREVINDLSAVGVYEARVPPSDPHARTGPNRLSGGEH